MKAAGYTEGKLTFLEKQSSEGRKREQSCSNYLLKKKVIYKE